MMRAIARRIHCFVVAMMISPLSAFWIRTAVQSQRRPFVATLQTSFADRIPTTNRWMSSSTSSDHNSVTGPQVVPKKAISRKDLYKKKTGRLRKLPVVKSPVEGISQARKITRKVKPDNEIQNVRLRERKHAILTLSRVSEKLCIPMRNCVRGYKTEWKRFHPFERVVADLTARARQQEDGLTLNKVLDDIHEARKLMLEATKDWMAKAKSAETAKEAREALNEGVDALFQLYQEFAVRPLFEIIQLQRSLRSAPVVRLDTPAVVLVGAPNVGKSTIVRKISSAQPEVNNYPFTTRGMTLGHVEVFWSDDTSIAKAVIPDNKRKPGSPSKEVITGKYAFSQLCQIMDSPGLLVRPDNERNEMEALTLAAMQHLPTAVMFVMDLSGEAGDKCSSVADQLQLRKEVRARFPRRPWIDVVSKVDMGVQDGALDDLEEILGGAPYIKLSIRDGQGVDELRSEVLRMLEEVRLVLDAMSVDEAVLFDLEDQ